MFRRPTPRQSAYSDFLGLRADSKDTKSSISGKIGARVDEIGEGDVELFCPNCGEPVHLTYTRRRFCDACRKPFFFYKGKLLTEEDATRIHNPFTKEDVKSFRQKYRSKPSSSDFRMQRFKRRLPHLCCTNCGASVGASVIKPDKYWICPECAAISVFDLNSGDFLSRDDYECRKDGESGKNTD